MMGQLAHERVEKTLHAYSQACGFPIYAANLCSSLRNKSHKGLWMDDSLYDSVIDNLLNVSPVVVNKKAKRSVKRLVSLQAYKMKSLLRRLIPKALLKYYRRLKKLRIQKTLRNKTAEEIFTEIYDKNQWGGSQGEFNSGPGSTEERIVSSYITMISEQAFILGFQGSLFVDLGCGDFNVGKQLLPLCYGYVGVDIVKSLVLLNQEKYGSTTIQFTSLDIAEDELPDGDICFIRQVFQHLSNQQISSVLKKLIKYKYVFITEHYPTDNEAIKPNIDKMHGADVRVIKNSGVYLTESPFELPAESLHMVQEVPGVGLKEEYDQGVIRTFLYTPQD
jgi:SAM-dependent methyltransferase